jgi:hypothetical protein
VELVQGSQAVECSRYQDSLNLDLYPATRLGQQMKQMRMPFDELSTRKSRNQTITTEIREIFRKSNQQGAAAHFTFSRRGKVVIVDYN